MEYEQQERVKRLEHFLKENTLNKFQHHTDQAAVESNLTWNSSRFWANVLYKAEPLGYKLSFDDFVVFKEQYEAQNGITIDSTKLFEDLLLRNVLGFIEIPRSISFGCLTLDKIKDSKAELEFLCHFYSSIPDNKMIVSKVDFQTSIDQYNTDHGTTIKLEQLSANKGWLHEKDTDNIELANIDIYYKPFLDHWDQLNFISALYKAKSDVKGVLINKQDFENLHANFGNLYPQITQLETLKVQKIIYDHSSTHYRINFYNSEPNYWRELCSEITGHYWELLLLDTTIESDVVRIRKFITQTAYWNGWGDPLSYVITTSKKRFLDAAIVLIKEDKDTLGSDDEFRKIIGDSSSSRSLDSLYTIKRSRNFHLNLSDHFEVYESFKLWDKKGHIEFHDQDCRDDIDTLVRIIVTHDFDIEQEEINVESEEATVIVHKFKRVMALLEECLNRPILLWFISKNILAQRRQIIPFLLTDDRYIAFGFQLIDELSFPAEQQAALSKKVWEKAIDLALLKIYSNDKAIASRIIFQIFRQLNHDKYDIPYNRASEKIETESLIGKEQKEQAVLSLIEGYSMRNGNFYPNNSRYFFPTIFDDLLKSFIQFDTKPFYNNGTIQFPMLQWDGLSWLMKCSTYWKYKEQFAEIPPDIHSLTNTFFNLYISRIEVLEVSKYNHKEETEEKALPLWSERIERLQFIEWIYPIYFIFKQRRLNSFLEPRFQFNTAESVYNEQNQFIADKLRTHIGVLLQVLRKLVLPSIPYGFEGKDLLEIKSRIERQIIDYLKVHTQDVPQQGRIDLLDYRKEVGFHNSSKEALLPQIARFINWFDDKQGIINAIVDSGDIDKMLTVAESVTSEGIKEVLISRIGESNLQEFLEESHWIPEIQSVFMKIRKYPDLIHKIEEIASYWEMNISKRDKQYVDQLYQTKLLIAYFHRDEKELDSIKEPEKEEIHGRKQLNSHDIKQFYRALIRMTNQPESAHSIFNNLSKAFPEYPTFALNRMAAKINVAHISNNSTLYAEALEEWETYHTENPNIDTSGLDISFFSNKLVLLSKLQKHEQFHKEYGNLDLPMQMIPQLLEIKVNMLLVEKRNAEALFLLESAERYHRLSNNSDITFIRSLRLLVNGIDDIEELRVHYNRIYNSSPSKLIQIFPEMLNGKSSIEEFITKETALAVNRMLDKVHALININDEDRYNDIVQLALESRISPWGWVVKDQTRKAFSPGEKDLGEIDMDIQDWNKNSFVTCEAFILRDVPRTQLHLEKLISHYVNQRKFFIILVYSLKHQPKFEDEWKKYSKTIVPNLSFPAGYEISAFGVEDVSKQFDFDKTAIKIGRSIHGSNTNMYHIFVNVDYKIGPAK